MHDEDVTQIYAYGENQIEGDVMIDTRENAKVTLIDLAGDRYTTGGLSGSSNIFATYDDELTILGGDNDDDVDLTLDSDVEDGELRIDLGDDGQDTLNINLNGDEIDTNGYGRHIDNVEYVNIDAPQGDGEAYLHFDGSHLQENTLRLVDMSDLGEDGGIRLNGDLSTNANYFSSDIAAVLANLTSVQFEATSALPVFSETAINAAASATTSPDGTLAGRLMVDGYVSDDDLVVYMTAGEDTIDLTIGESEYYVEAALTSAGSTTVTEAVGIAMADVIRVLNPIPEITAVPQIDFAGHAEEVNVFLGGGDDQVSLVLGSAQQERVTLSFSRADVSDHDTVTFNVLEDLGAMAEVNGATTTNNTPIIDNVGLASGLTFDFEDDITTIMTAPSATDASSIDVAGSQQGALIVYGRSDFAVQRGMLYDHDGDGQLSDGDTVLDLTNVLMVPGSFAYQDASSTNYPFLASDIIIANSESVGLMTNGLDLIPFTLSDGNLVA